MHEPRCNNILHQLLDSSRGACRVIHWGLPCCYLFVQDMQGHIGRNIVVDSYSADSLDRCVMVNNAAIRNYKLVQ